MTSSTTISNTTSGLAFDIDCSAFVTAIIKFVTFTSGNLVALFEGSVRSSSRSEVQTRKQLLPQIEATAVLSEVVVFIKFTDCFKL